MQSSLLRRGNREAAQKPWASTEGPLQGKAASSHAQGTLATCGDVLVTWGEYTPGLSMGLDTAEYFTVHRTDHEEPSALVVGPSQWRSPMQGIGQPQQALCRGMAAMSLHPSGLTWAGKVSPSWAPTLTLPGAPPS